LSGAGSGVSPQTCASPSIVAALPYPLSLLSISGLNKEGDTVLVHYIWSERRGGHCKPGINHQTIRCLGLVPTDLKGKPTLGQLAYKVLVQSKCNEFVAIHKVLGLNRNISRYSYV